MFSLCLTVLVSGILCGCTPGTDNDQVEKKKYSIYILGNEHREYIIQTDGFAAGNYKPETDGVKLNTDIIDRDVVIRDGFYYHLNGRNHILSKYVKTAGELKEVGTLEIRNFIVENYYWIARDTLLLTGLDQKTFTNSWYYKISVGDLKLVQSGLLPIPKPGHGFTSTSIGLTTMLDGKLFLGYTYHKQLDASNYTTSDTAYITSLSYPALKTLHTDKDTRSTYPGGDNTIQNYSFNDEAGNFYYMTCPGIALGNRTDLPTGIFRINKGADTLDRNYFFNISAAISNHAYGLWYIGNNKAIIRCERKDLYKDLNDHWDVAHFEFYVVDLLKQTKEKLNLPLDRGTRRECVIAEGDKVYIAVNSKTDGNYIWCYTPSTKSLVKGLQLSGDTDYIYRIDKNF
ncbi:hypothetical protein BC343_09040 [Mucilaginibacter pedocola]|uniref:DUF4374 domain-containing protein n=1 Tax=Mucilaginibacter pedocola TaxID=1792845 RepID=A0A1S9PD72_9SPHI|nr:hypothetical protein BC343_09040 [Mucilaginibacter pedocola]